LRTKDWTTTIIGSDLPLDVQITAVVRDGNVNGSVRYGEEGWAAAIILVSWLVAGTRSGRAVGRYELSA